MSQNTDPLHPFRRRLQATRIVIAAERGARAFWPAVTVLLIAFAAWRFGGLWWLSQEIGSWAVLGGIAVLLGATLVLGVRRFDLPRQEEAIARLDATTARRLLTTLSDRPAMPTDPAQRAVWEAHQARAQAAADAVRVPSANLQVSRFDRYGLRLAAAIAALSALVFAQGGGLARFENGAGGALAAGPTFEAWATPPAYTGLATLYLTERAEDPTPLVLPEGTEIALRAYGEGFALEQDVSAVGALSEIAPGLNDARLVLRRDGDITLERDGATLASWSFNLSGDLAPSIRFDGDVTRARAGATEIPFAASDDFEVVEARVRIRRDLERTDRTHGLAVAPEPRDDLVVTFDLPRRGGEDVAEVFSRDLSKHPFAGLPVSMVLEAVDGAGQTGSSELRHVVLPQRSFFDPLSRAIVEQRRDLLWAPEANARRVEQLLRAVSYKPDEIETPEGVPDALRAAIAAVDAARDEGMTAERTDELAELLWELALMIEDGRLADAAANLRRAQERLSQALQNGASDEEIAELMQQLREAMREYMEQMAEELRNDPEAQQRAQEQSGEGGMDMSQQDLQDLMDRIQELSENGQREEAQRLLDQLAQLLENMQMTMNGGGQGEGMEGGSPGGQEGSPQEGVQDTLRQQQELADRAFEELQRQFRDSMGQGQPGQGEAEGEGEGLQGLADTQEALREMLDGMGDGDLDDTARERLDEAERNMADARDALEAENGRRALDNQALAMDALREALRALDAAEAGETAPRQGDASSESEQRGESRDPLGRPMENGRAIDGGETAIPDGGSIGDARDLLDEIRRRSGERDRTAEERDYLRRLLDRF